MKDDHKIKENAYVQEQACIPHWIGLAFEFTF